MPFWIIPAFFLTALLYASVGFGGGSTYSALLAVSGIETALLPAISLCCNIVVVTGGTFRFARAGLVDWRRALPLALVAAPFAYLGGLTPIKETTFLALLAFSLTAAGLALLLQRNAGVADERRPSPLAKAALPLSAGLGYLAGLVGIGGGIFLAPFLHLTRWAAARQIAATASLFILINSVTGLAGQTQKLAASGKFPDLAAYWPLAAAVLIGGQIGSTVSIKLLSPRIVRMLTGVLTLYVACTLFWKLYGP